MRSRSCKAGVLAVAIGFSVGAASACGPWFPNRLLSEGGAGMLVAPDAMFIREIQAMNLISSTHQAVLATNGYGLEVASAEAVELKAALSRLGEGSASVERILREHESQRAVLSEQIVQRERWEAAQRAWWSNTNIPPTPLPPGAVRVTAGLPGEFADYFEGAIAWHCGLTNAACVAWEKLLQRPAGERHFRSTWAAFMLGKATWETNPLVARKWFQRVRQLAKEGFADNLGLAASSLGWEARVELRVELRGQNFTRAMDLYLEQASAGDGSAYESLRYAAELALREQATALKPLAKHSRAQRVITAYLIAGGWADAPVDVDGTFEPVLRLLERQTFVAPPAGGWHNLQSPARLWLEAVEAAKVRDVESAEKLALAAYQSGQMAIARRWIERAPDSLTAQWLKAKLLLRDGNVQDAAALLATLTRQFPASPAETNAVAGSLLARLSIRDMRWDNVPSATQLLGELGALRLTRREYVEALDALLRSGYDSDAAYVADRVLTLEEFKAYVDRHWPQLADGQTSDSDAGQNIRSGIRNLLGARLVRAGQFQEALNYFTGEDRRQLEVYLTAITAGRDQERPKTERAEMLWRGAQTVFGCTTVFAPPVETDWSLQSGLFTFSDRPPQRLLPVKPRVLPVTGDEHERVKSSAVYPDRSWYHRFIAANLAWEAAQLMPDNSDETARVLWQGGTWIKYADPQAADVFYKALVRRCGNTALGEAADRRRWFPFLDEQGNILPFKERVAAAITDAIVDEGGLSAGAVSSP